MKIKNSVAILVFNDKEELALQLRAAHDDSYPSHWDFSAAGGIQAGEEPDVAAVRELQEEIGIQEELRFIEKVFYKDEKEQGNIFLYSTQHNGPFHPDANEVADIRFFSLNLIEQMIAEGEKFHPEFPFVWKLGIIQKHMKETHDTV